MMQRTAVINVVGLTESLLGSSTPAINAFQARGQRCRIEPAIPVVTCTAQATYLTGTPASAHGIVANGWYDRDLAEVHFWKQSNHLVRGRKVWEELRALDPKFTCAKLFWWYNMYSSADISITPRPMYPADGRKVFDIYTHPASLRHEITADLGPFPFPTFWGPAAGRDTPQGPSDAASQWIAASARWVEARWEPTLHLIYLPHLDYNLQRLGPDDPQIPRDVEAIDRIVGELISYFESRSVRVLLLSEYGISAVTQPIHLNRLFRDQGWLAIKEELGLELLDAGASRVFAVADHQVAHIYVKETGLVGKVRALLENQPGVGRVVQGPDRSALGLDNGRAGDLVVLAQEQAWFTYYYWLEDAKAPDFARCVDIHRKPGFDPVELFIDPRLAFPKLRILRRLLQKKLGFRMLMDVIPLDARLVKGSHGILPRDPALYPLLICGEGGLRLPDTMPATAVYETIKQAVMQKRRPEKQEPPSGGKVG